MKTKRTQFLIYWTAAMVALLTANLSMDNPTVFAASFSAFVTLTINAIVCQIQDAP